MIAKSATKLSPKKRRSRTKECSVNKEFGVGDYSSTIPRRARRKIARARAKKTA